MKLEPTKKRLGTAVYTEFNEVAETLTSRKGNRGVEMGSATVTVNGVPYDADEDSMDRMNRIVSLANAEFAYRLSVGEAYASAYTNSYKIQQVTWTGADNIVHTVQIESIVEALRQSMINMGNIWGKYAV